MVLERIADVATHGSNRPRIVVIGAGAVGLYTASELARSGREAVVVESGGAILDTFGPDSFASVGRTHEGIGIGRSRSIGGTSNLWGGQLAELQPIDFEGREWLPNSAWPVSYAELSPFYARTYENLGIAEEAQNDEDVWEALRRDAPGLGEGLEVFLTRWLPIPSFAVAKAKQIEESHLLLLLPNHTAIGFEGEQGQVTGVRLRDREGNVHVLEGDAFLVAAGTIETVRLLLASASARDWDCPWRGNDLLGARFQDHLGGRVANVQPEDLRMFFKTYCNIVCAGRKYQPKLRLTNESLSAFRILNIQGMFVFESSITENLVYLKQFAKAAIYSRRISSVRDLYDNLRACWKYLVPIMWAYAKEHRVFEPRTSAVSLVVQAEQTPLNESRIRLDTSVTDVHGLPRVVLDWRIGSEELDSIAEFTDRADRALRASGVAALEIDEALRRRSSSFLTKLRDTNHQSGGAIMGRSDSHGVVDRDLRVFGTKNLYIGGAATFPTIGGANTTFTALAFATRLVDRLTSAHAAR
jgi:choline dehydrogenase-like flavoprotein